MKLSKSMKEATSFRQETALISSDKKKVTPRQFHTKQTIIQFCFNGK